MSVRNSSARRADPTATGKYARGGRIERSRMADRSLPEQAADPSNHIVAGPARRFVDDQRDREIDLRRHHVIRRRLAPRPTRLPGAETPPVRLPPRDLASSRLGVAAAAEMGSDCGDIDARCEGRILTRHPVSFS